MDRGSIINGRQILHMILSGGLTNIKDLSPVPDFGSFSYQVADLPNNIKSKAWTKLQECERRSYLADWAMQGTDPVTGKNKILAEDLIVALFCSIEATIQILKAEVDIRYYPGFFDKWIAKHSHYSIPVRAFRTIRHFIVHIEALTPSSSMDIPLFPTPKDQWVTRKWFLPEINSSQLSSLRTPKLRINDLPDWNKIRSSEPAGEIIKKVLNDLRKILMDSEQMLKGP